MLILNNNNSNSSISNTTNNILIFFIQSYFVFIMFIRMKLNYKKKSPLCGYEHYTIGRV